MRPEIEKILVKMDDINNAGQFETDLAELLKLANDDEEKEEVFRRIEEIIENHKVEGLRLQEEARRLREEGRQFQYWVLAQMAAGRPRSELTRDDFLRETNPAAWQAEQERRKGPHSPEEQVFYDALKGVRKNDELGGFKERDLLVEMVRLMDARPAFDGKDKRATAQRVWNRHKLG
jgi:hypothetical protein